MSVDRDGDDGIERRVPGMTVLGRRFRPAIPVVESKLRPPTQRGALIERPRLTDMLVDVAGPPVVTLIAPPGYGKTTLLAQWVARETRPVAWLTIDDLDNDPAVLISYLATALDRIAPIDDTIRDGIAAPGGRILATAVPRLLAQVHGWEMPAVLVLDDAHRLVDRIALDAVGSFLGQLPPGFRIAIAARMAPDLPFARLRAAGTLLEIETRQLALTEQEVAEAAAADRLTLRPDDVRVVHVQTEGWAAGIRLAALAIARGETSTATLATVSGRDRYVAAYFRSEFQRSLEPDDLAVLTRTSILETITPKVAEKVSGIDTAWRRLAEVAAQSLFVQDVGAVVPAYRYHNLLRDFLLGELDEREPGARPELHRLAAASYAAADDRERAVEHAFASGDLGVIVSHVTAATLPTFFGGHPATVDRWIQRLDEKALLLHPPLAVIAAWIHLLAGRAGAADRSADIAEGSTYAGPTGDGSASFESQRATLQAMMVRHGPAQALASAQLAARSERAGSPWEGTALGVLGGAHRMLGHMEEAEAAFTAGAATGNMASAAFAAALALERGDWEAAEVMSARARAILAATHFGELLQSIAVFAVDARLAIHQGDLARTREDLVRAQRVLPLASHAAPWLVVDALLHLARAYLALADTAGARLALREAGMIVRRRPALGVLTTELSALEHRLRQATATLAGSSSLTPAELRLLPFLPTYLTFQEIAERLYLSYNTVKTHAISIYSRLNVSSRSEAVERAVELGLLEPLPGLERARTPRLD